MILPWKKSQLFLTNAHLLVWVYAQGGPTGGSGPQHYQPHQQLPVQTQLLPERSCFPLEARHLGPPLLAVAIATISGRVIATSVGNYCKSTRISRRRCAKTSCGNGTKSDRQSAKLCAGWRRAPPVCCRLGGKTCPQARLAYTVLKITGEETCWLRQRQINSDKSGEI